jgi:hypothetical protein
MVPQLQAPERHFNFEMLALWPAVMEASRDSEDFSENRTQVCAASYCTRRSDAAGFRANRRRNRTCLQAFSATTPGLGSGRDLAARTSGGQRLSS